MEQKKYYGEVLIADGISNRISLNFSDSTLEEVAEAYHCLNNVVNGSYQKCESVFVDVGEDLPFPESAILSEKYPAYVEYTGAEDDEVFEVTAMDVKAYYPSMNEAEAGIEAFNTLLRELFSASATLSGVYQGVTLTESFSTVRDEVFAASDMNDLIG